jgi:hypothetical protein
MIATLAKSQKCKKEEEKEWHTIIEKLMHKSNFIACATQVNMHAFDMM